MNASRRLVREKEPLDDPDETHGVCAEHKARLEAAGANTKLNPTA